MAVAEDFDTQTSGADDWLSCADSAMGVVIASLIEAPFGPACAAIERYRDELNALEALHIAKRKEAGFTDRSTEGIIKGSGKVSKGEAKKRTKRAEAVKNNPALADKLSDGTLSTEKIDLVADAAAKTGGDAACDSELINNIADANPDQGKAIAKKYVDEHDSAADRSSRYRWQRKGRKVYKGRSANGRAQLIVEGDDESIDASFKRLRQRSDAMYRGDGGRDVPDDQHQRTHDQRMFDAAIAQLMGDPSNAAAPEPSESAGSTASTSGSSSAPPSASPPSSSDAPTPAASPPADTAPASANRPGQRPVMVFTGKLTDITDDPDMLAEWEAELIGTGVVPSEVASYYRCISEHGAMLLSGKGEVLWFGRTRRLVSTGQWKALIARDKGCVLCCADHTMCEAHHIIPWESRAKGNSDIDEFAMVCTDCHHRIHDNDQTLFWDQRNQKWRLRAATPDEIAPKRRKPGPDAKPRGRPESHRRPSPGIKARPTREPNPETVPTGATYPAPDSSGSADQPGIDPHSRETEHGTLRHDLFDWLE